MPLRILFNVLTYLPAHSLSCVHIYIEREITISISTTFQQAFHKMCLHFLLLHLSPIDIVICHLLYIMQHLQVNPYYFVLCHPQTLLLQDPNIWCIQQPSSISITCSYHYNFLLCTLHLILLITSFSSVLV